MEDENKRTQCLRGGGMWTSHVPPNTVPACPPASGDVHRLRCHACHTQRRPLGHGLPCDVHEHVHRSTDDCLGSRKTTHGWLGQGAGFCALSPATSRRTHTHTHTHTCTCTHTHARVQAGEQTSVVCAGCHGRQASQAHGLVARSPFHSKCEGCAWLTNRNHGHGDDGALQIMPHVRLGPGRPRGV